ncbi:deacylase, partial [Candidatus Poribacteria bacterium]|nr:deacylase [Candidatus Poribacteria bacterium]
MKSTLKVGKIEAKPGTVEYGFMDAGEMQDGSTAKIPVALINGSQHGDILYLQSVSDGNELNGVAVVHHILNTIKPDELKGALIIIPIVNVFAFFSKQTYNPADNKKMNRCFPGDNKGTSSQRISHKIFHQAVLQAKYCIDLH